MGVDEGGHDDHTLGVDEFRLGVFGLKGGGFPDLQDLGALHSYAAVFQIGQGAVPGDEFSVCDQIHEPKPP